MSFTRLRGPDDPYWGEFLHHEHAFVTLFTHLWHAQGLDLCALATTLHSVDALAAIVRRNVREAQFDCFRSGSTPLVILGNYDLTFPVFLPQRTGWGVLRGWVEAVGLSLLADG